MPGKLTKADLIREIARNCESSLKEGKQLLEIILDAIARALARGEHVHIRGFGAFATRARDARVGRNPETGAKVEVQAKRSVYFRASKNLKKLL